MNKNLGGQKNHPNEGWKIKHSRGKSCVKVR